MTKYVTIKKSIYQIFDSNRLKCSHPIGEPQTKDCGQYHHQPRTKKGGGGGANHS
jgi:hypothetical protein